MDFASIMRAYDAQTAKLVEEDELLLYMFKDMLDTKSPEDRDRILTDLVKKTDCQKRSGSCCFGNFPYQHATSISVVMGVFILATISVSRSTSVASVSSETTNEYRTGFSVRLSFLRRAHQPPAGNTAI